MLKRLELNDEFMAVHVPAICNSIADFFFASGGRSFWDIYSFAL